MQIEQSKRDQIIEALKLGMPMGNAADLVPISLELLKQEIEADPDFSVKVRQAIAECMHARLKTLAGLKNWQAIAFILQSLWPERFGRKSRGTTKRRRSQQTGPQPDPARLTEDETRKLDELLAKLHGRNTVTIVTGSQKCLPGPG
jgi:hypothetical protein